MQLRHHTALFQLLRREPRFSPEAERAVAERERVCGRRFPGSVREWFSLEGVRELFRKYTNDDELVAVEELGDPAEVAKGYLRVAVENQGVVAWYVRLDGSDEPPVLDNNDQWDEDLAKVSWNFHSATFQNFLFDMVSGQVFGGWRNGMHLKAVTASPGEDVLGRLRSCLSEGPRTETPELRVCRFFGPHGLLSVRSDVGGAGDRTEWELDADSSDGLAELVRLVWRVDGMATAIEPYSATRSDRARGHEVIARVARELGGRNPDAPFVDPCGSSTRRLSGWERFVRWLRGRS